MGLQNSLHPTMAGMIQALNEVRADLICREIDLAPGDGMRGEYATAARLILDAKRIMEKIKEMDRLD